MGTQIFERHIRSHCVEPINIDNTSNRDVELLVQKRNFAPNLFDSVQYQIFHLLKYDCWPRYLRSEELAECAANRLHSGMFKSQMSFKISFF